MKISKTRKANKPKKITSASLRPVGVPLTVKERYDYLLKKNPNLNVLKEVFQLEVEL